MHESCKTCKCSLIDVIVQLLLLCYIHYSIYSQQLGLGASINHTNDRVGRHMSRHFCG